MKKNLLSVGDIVIARKNGETVPGIVINLDTYKAEIAFEQSLDDVKAVLVTNGITYGNILHKV